MKKGLKLYRYLGNKHKDKPHEERQRQVAIELANISDDEFNEILEAD